MLLEGRCLAIREVFLQEGVRRTRPVGGRSIPTGAVGLMSATLAQTDTALTGSISLSNSLCFPGGPLSGTITGNTIAATIAISGIQLAALSGTVTADGNTIDGAYAVTSGSCEGDYGIFTLKRSQ